jgi:hypothetical protein
LSIRCLRLSGRRFPVPASPSSCGRWRSRPPRRWPDLRSLSRNRWQENLRTVIIFYLDWCSRPFARWELSSQKASGLR